MVQIDWSITNPRGRIDVHDLDVFTDWAWFQFFPVHLKNRFVDLKEVGIVAEKRIISEHAQFTGLRCRQWRIHRQIHDICVDCDCASRRGGTGAVTPYSMCLKRLAECLRRSRGITEGFDYPVRIGDRKI